jgi:hypothetical protein
MQINSGSIAGLVSTDHVGFNVAGGGQHKQVTFNSNNVPGIFPVTPPVLFTQIPTGLALPELFYYSGDAAHSSNQYVVTSTSTNGSAMMLGGIIIKWGSIASINNGHDLTFVSPFPNACFSVQVTLNIASSVTPIGINGFTKTKFTFRSTVGGGVPITYIAIGN